MNSDKSINYKNLILKKPIWTIRYGSGLMLFFLITTLLMSYLIKYPEYIEAKINIVSEDHIKRLISKRGGNLHIITRSGENVFKGQELAYIENPSIEILKIRKIIDSINNNLELLENQNFELDTNINLGELEPFYIDFLKKRKDFFAFKSISTKKKNRKNLGRSLNLNSRVKQEFLGEKKILEKEFLLEKEKLKRLEKLNKEGIVSMNDLNKAQQEFLEYEKKIQNSIISSSQISVREMEIANEIDNLEYQIKEDEIKYHVELENAFNRLKSEIFNWSHNFSFITPIDGKAIFNSNWSNGEYISENQEFAVVVPNNKSEIFCIGLMKSFNSGKVLKGQKVKIYLDSYNYEEYGILEGIVHEVFTIPEKNKEGEYFYKVKIKLTKGLTTSLNKKIPYSPDLNGDARIVTKDISLLERLFLKIIKVIKK